MRDFLRHDEGWIFGTLAVGVFALVVAVVDAAPQPVLDAEPVVYASSFEGEDEVDEEVAPTVAFVRWEAHPAVPAPVAPIVTAPVEGAPPPVAVAPSGRQRVPAEVAVEDEKPERSRNKKAKKKSCDEAPDPAIVEVADGRWRVNKSVVRRYSQHWGRLDELGWSRSHDGPDGKADGMQIGGIRCGSDLYDAGFRSGDVVHSVNGRAIKNITTAIFAYTALANDREFRVVLSRRGERRTLRFSLVG